MHFDSRFWLTALVPIIWGTTFLITKTWLPDGYPLTMALIRALPAGLILMLISRELPKGDWVWKALILGALNITIFLSLLFASAYRIPGGMAAVLNSSQPLIVIFLAVLILGSPLRRHKLVTAATGITGVSLIVLKAPAIPDLIGVIAGIGAAISMATGVVLTKKWSDNAPSMVTLAGWQLTLGGLMLLPLAMIFEPPLPTISTNNMIGYLYLTFLSGALTYYLWFRGISKMDVSTVSMLGFLSPMTAIALDWFVLDEPLSTLQGIGVMLVLMSVIMNARTAQAKPARA